MKVLIVEESAQLGALWAAHFARLGLEVFCAGSEEDALTHLYAAQPDVIVVDLDLPGSGSMGVADYAAYRYPDARVVFVTSSSFFSDGSIFSMSPNAAAFLPARTPPEDLAAVVEFHGRRKAPGS